MEGMIRKYADKLVKVGLCEPDAPLIGFLDADVVWNRPDPLTVELQKVFDSIIINSLLFALPTEPYRTMIRYLSRSGETAIYPKDCETRTFLHDLPIAGSPDAATIVAALKRRKTLIIPEHGIITFGTVSPEQAFIFYSSVCFSVFVKFFSDYLLQLKQGTLTDEFRQAFRDVRRYVPERIHQPPARLAVGPFTQENRVIEAIIEAGAKTVEYELVDSFFGNISYRMGDTIYISQTSSSLDELGGCIDPCPLDGSSCAGVTASSELKAHRETYLQTGAGSIIHGHPKFSVIMSMDCDEPDCEQRGECHRRCPRTRYIDGVPIVPGEVGTGPFGLCNTLPAAMVGHPGVIVYGHGVFAPGKVDFTDAFDTLLGIETGCRDTYFRMVGE
ncbi:class II aldolase/adducin family protein [bacterium]|nr:class II aldolase/adducin family protein [candidate division CSSED10-310 bacterium]